MSDKEAEYNGWTNFETRSVHLWMTKHPELFPPFIQPGIDAYRTAGRDRERGTRLLADKLREMMKTQSQGVAITGLWRDLLDASIETVNWYEIAGAVMVDVIDAVENY